MTVIQQRNGFYNNTRSKLGAAGEEILESKTPTRRDVIDLKDDEDEEKEEYESRYSVVTPKSKKRYDEITYYSIRSKSTTKTGKTGRLT